VPTTSQEPEPASPRALAEQLRRLGYALHDSQHAMAAALGIGLTDLQAVERVMLDGALGPAELGAAIGVRPASVTALVDRLERSGHVVRTPHPTDRRRQVLHATAKAQSDGWAAIAPLVAGLIDAAADLDDEQRATVALYLDRVTEALRTYARAAPGRTSSEE
jgi:DNA-binding MarR family transcriptional regulator